MESRQSCPSSIPASDVGVGALFCTIWIFPAPQDCTPLTPPPSAAHSYPPQASRPPNFSCGGTYAVPFYPETSSLPFSLSPSIIQNSAQMSLPPGAFPGLTSVHHPHTLLSVLCQSGFSQGGLGARAGTGSVHLLQCLAHCLEPEGA